MDRIKTLIDKEWAEAFKNKMVLGTVVFMPLIFMVLPLFQLALMRNIPASELNDVPSVILAGCQAQNFTASECMQGFLVNQFLLLFLLIPLAVPVTIASYSIVGEKSTRSLEPLLATPTSTTEIILGKALASVIPAIGATWAAFVIFLMGARFFVVSDRVYTLFTNSTWYVAMLAVAPLMTVLSVNIAIIISSRVNDPRAAEQLGMLVMLPLMLLFFGAIFGLIPLNVTTMLLLAVITLALDAGLVVLGVKLFQRETILTRWK
ncbi:MAG TPA: ABC transporter permease subunit [Anaerolineae bacterium]|nr:ABC transporter permease subunit [Anaerolineae bacterium]